MPGICEFHGGEIVYPELAVIGHADEELHCSHGICLGIERLHRRKPFLRPLLVECNGIIFLYLA